MMFSSKCNGFCRLRRCLKNAQIFKRSEAAYCTRKGADGKIAFRNQFRFSNPPQQLKTARSENTGTSKKRGLPTTAPQYSDGVVGGSLFDEEGDETKSRVDNFTRRYELLNGRHLQIKGEILYGVHPVSLALQSGKRTPYKLFIKQSDGSGKETERKHILQMAKERNIPIVHANTRMLDIIATGHVHQGVCMDAQRRDFLDHSTSLDFGRPIEGITLWLLLDHIQDPMNFGAILRSAFYFGVDKLFVNRDENCRLSPVASKASSGVLEAMDVYGISNVPSFLRQQKERGFSVVGTRGVAPMHANEGPDVGCKDVELSSYVVSKPSILVIGHEGRGIAARIRDHCDCFLNIPSFCSGDILDSLNVSVATGILLHHLSNTRNNRVVVK